MWSYFANQVTITSESDPLYPVLMTNDPLPDPVAEIKRKAPWRKPGLYRERITQLENEVTRLYGVVCDVRDVCDRVGAVVPANERETAAAFVEIKRIVNEVRS